MLRRLSIRNFVLIDEADLALGPGLTVLTGETGGGKSVLATAVGLFAGVRARADFVRKGTARASIEGEFDAGDSRGSVVVRREIDRGGKSRSFLDGSAVGMARVKDELGRLLCLTSQHEQVTLVSTAVQRDMLDEFGENGPLLAEYGQAFARWREALARLQRLRSSEAERESRLDFLRHQVREIRAAALKKGEDEEIRATLSVVKHTGRISEALTLASRELFDGEESAEAKVARVAREVERASGGTGALAECAGMLSDLQSLLAELERTVGATMEKLEFDEADLDAMQERLYAIERLKKKHHGGIDDILEGLGRMEEEIAMLENLDGSLESMEREAAARRQGVLDLAGSLRSSRLKAARGLKKAVGKELAELAFGQADFEVDVQARQDLAGDEAPEAWLDETGGDEVEFLLRPNRGEDLAPLRRIASGGELSRVLLALKVALRSGGRGETFVFDEIDAGIGGAVAEAVGKKLHELGRTNQVLCITHLPQIACFGDHHLLVGKRVEGGRTVTYLSDLDGADRAGELARMLGGETITRKGREAAKELLAAARDFKNRNRT
jgi:DNA repair protein RecN (Recombination protein N)